MKINFTKKEYRTLVEMLLIADWVLHAHEIEPREETAPYDVLRKKVLAHHKEMGMEDEFRYAPEHDDYFETAEYEAEAPHMRFIGDYDSDTFWAQFVDRLAARDLAAEAALHPSGLADKTERLTRLAELTERYNSLLAESGLDCIRFDPKTR